MERLMTYPIFTLLLKGERKKPINIIEGDFGVDDAPDYLDEHCTAIHSFLDCFHYATQIK